MSRTLIVGLALLLAACSNDPENNVDPNASANNANSNANSNTANSNTPDMGTPNNAPDVGGGDDTGMGEDMNGPGPDPDVVLLNPDDCYDFSTDPDVPLAIDGAFDADSPVWRRPHDDEPVCPASALLPDGSALVPYIAVKFCNTTRSDLTFNFEFLGQDGPAGEQPLEDAYLVLYNGEELPADHRQCLAVNDDIDGAIDSGDSEILGVEVAAGDAITVVGTTYTFDPTDGTGAGGFVLIVSSE